MERKIFKKSDLESGMVIETRNKRRYLVVNKDIMIGSDGFLDLNHYNESLKEIERIFKDWDIDKVFKPKRITFGFNRMVNCSETLLWERYAVKEFTIKEIADLLNIPVEQLRIKDVSSKYKCDFKKESFKPGMIVEVYNGVSKTYCMVVPTICSGLCISGEYDWEPLFDFDDNLMKGSLEIIKVYGLCKINKDSHKICIDNRDLLWSKPVEYTLADIAYRLDIPVEALKIKN